jgi:hypothetical protein
MTKVWPVKSHTPTKPDAVLNLMNGLSTLTQVGDVVEAVWGGRPRPLPAPWPACQQGGRGRPPRSRGTAPPSRPERLPESSGQPFLMICLQTDEIAFPIGRPNSARAPVRAATAYRQMGSGAPRLDRGNEWAVYMVMVLAVFLGGLRSARGLPGRVSTRPPQPELQPGIPEVKQNGHLL